MIRVYRFGLLPPTQNKELVHEQLRASKRYRNRLVEIEKARRASLRQIMTEQGDTKDLETAAVEALNAELAIAKKISALRSEARNRTLEPFLKDSFAAAKIVTKATKQALYERRKQLREDPSLQPARDAVDERAAEVRKAARAACGLYWGSYLLVENEDQQSRKTPLYDELEPSDPRFVRFVGEGRLGVQLQGGLPVEKLFGTDLRLRIESVSEDAWYSPSRSVRRKASRSVLWMRVGSDEKSRPIWATWPTIVHKEIPKGSVIKEATVNLRIVSQRHEWWLTITADVPATAAKKHGRGPVALNFGWRQFDDGIRVATWGCQDSKTSSWVSYDGSISPDSNDGELRLPNTLIQAIRKSDEIRSIRDMNFDIAKMKLENFLSIHQHIPDWMKEGSSTVKQWKSPKRIVGLVRKWKELTKVAVKLKKVEIDGSIRMLVESTVYPDKFDSAIDSVFRDLEEFLIHDLHLWKWEAMQRNKALGHRREIYRIFASKLVKRFDTLVIDNFDLRHVARQQAFEDETQDNKTSRGNRQLASVSELRLCLCNAFKSANATVEKMSSVNVTITCHSCGNVEKFDAASQICHTCTKCGTLSDQDVQAWKNLMSRFEQARDKKNVEAAREESNDAPVLEKTESRWVKARRMAAEKKMRKEALAKVSGNK